jgi:hypothetical protein
MWNKLLSLTLSQALEGRSESVFGVFTDAQLCGESTTQNLDGYSFFVSSLASLFGS